MHKLAPSASPFLQTQGWSKAEHPTGSSAMLNLLSRPPFNSGLPSPVVKQGVQHPPNYIINTGAVRGAGTDANLNPQPLQPHHHCHPAIFLMLLVLLCSCRMGLATAAEAPCLEVSKRCLTADDRAPCRGARCKLPTGIY